MNDQVEPTRTSSRSNAGNKYQAPNPETIRSDDKKLKISNAKIASGNSKARERFIRRYELYTYIIKTKFLQPKKNSIRKAVSKRDLLNAFLGQNVGKEYSFNQLKGDLKLLTDFAQFLRTVDGYHSNLTSEDEIYATILQERCAVQLLHGCSDKKQASSVVYIGMQIAERLKINSANKKVEEKSQIHYERQKRASDLQLLKNSSVSSSKYDALNKKHILDSSDDDSSNDSTVGEESNDEEINENSKRLKNNQDNESATGFFKKMKSQGPDRRDTTRRSAKKADLKIGGKMSNNFITIKTKLAEKADEANQFMHDFKRSFGQIHERMERSEKSNREFQANQQAIQANQQAIMEHNQKVNQEFQANALKMQQAMMAKLFLPKD